MGSWHGAQGHKAWPITGRDPRSGNYSYTIYLKRQAHVTWEGEYKGFLTEFVFTLLSGDTELLELRREIP